MPVCHSLWLHANCLRFVKYRCFEALVIGSGNARLAAMADLAVSLGNGRQLNRAGLVRAGVMALGAAVKAVERAIGEARRDLCCLILRSRPVHQRHTRRRQFERSQS